MQISGFWTLRGVKNANFEKSLNKPWDDHTRHICTNFQLSNPYLFRKTPRTEIFRCTFRVFGSLRGVKKVYFRKHWTRRKMIIQDTFVPIFSFLTPTYSEKQLRNGNFQLQISGFWTLRGVKKANFAKSLNMPWTDHSRHICTNFHLSNPYLFWKVALDGNFWMQISGFWTPRGVKNVNFEKSFNTPWDDHTRHICTNFELSNPYLLRKTALNKNFWM